MRSRPRHLDVRVDMVTPEGRTAFARALRMLAAKEGGHATYVDEFARVLFNEIFLDGDPEERFASLLKLVEALACLAGLTIDVALAELEEQGIDGSWLDFLTALERAVESRIGPISEAG